MTKVHYDERTDVLTVPTFAANVDLVHAHVERDGRDTLILCKFRIRNFRVPQVVERLLVMLSFNEVTYARDVRVRERPLKPSTATQEAIG